MFDLSLAKAIYILQRVLMNTFIIIRHDYRHSVMSGNGSLLSMSLGLMCGK